MVFLVEDFQSNRRDNLRPVSDIENRKVRSREFSFSETLLSNAFEQNQFVGYYQPKVCVESGAICGFEVLARWEHPEYGVMEPACFLHRLDNSNRHSDLFFALLDEVFSIINSKNCCIDWDFSINLDGSVLSDPNFRQRLAGYLEAGLSAKRIKLEITEVKYICDVSSSESLRWLIISGFKLSLDDYGVGYSSLARLQSYCFSEIKLDRSFIKKINTSTARTIIESTVALSRALNVELVVEGIETLEQHLFVSQYSGVIGQGYFYSKPFGKESLFALF